VPTDAASLAAAVDAHLHDFLAARRRLLEPVGVEALALVDEATVSVMGGKRLRPAFCVAGWQVAGGDADDPRVVRAAAALELLQASALVHDDLMDGSDTRRGRPATHRAFAERHDAAGWRAAPDRFGAGAAILLGDLLLTWSHELFRTSGFDPVTVDRAAPLFDACTTEVVAGQYLDLVSQAMGRSDEDLALRVVRFKAASYTVVRPLHIGAALAGADESLLTALTAYGEPLGIAFQLRDDVLGVFGDPEQTGKPAGDDLREGKRTVLLARATQSADPAGRALLDRCVGHPDLTADDLTGLRRVIVDSGALASVEATITELEGRAHGALDAVCAGRDGTARSVLEALTSAALRRTR
jgi:geranylgeranyl diphosphate synthase, type I